jgi:hypothetical protein
MVICALYPVDQLDSKLKSIFTLPSVRRVVLLCTVSAFAGSSENSRAATISKAVIDLFCMESSPFFDFPQRIPSRHGYVI